MQTKSHASYSSDGTTMRRMQEMRLSNLNQNDDLHYKLSIAECEQMVPKEYGKWNWDLLQDGMSILSRLHSHRGPPSAEPHSLG